MGRRRVVPWSPDNGAPQGPQRRLLVDLANVFEVLSAGSVGSGKTDAALMGPVVYPEYRTHPRFKALILRHSDGNKVKTGDAFSEFYQRIEEPGRWRRYVGGSLNRTEGQYRFRSGGQVLFTSTRDLRSLHGPEFQYVFPDELTHWPDPRDYLYAAFTRARSADGLTIRIRPTTNPGGPGHLWVRARWGPWLASDYLSQTPDGKDLYPGAASLRALGFSERHAPDGKLLPPVDSGTVLHFLLEEGGSETYVPAGTPGALTRSCLRTKTSDNAALAASDPTYLTRVRAVGATLGAQLGADDWDVQTQDTGVFARPWWKLVAASAVPQLAGVVRRWDFAWTKKKRSDWSVGVKLGWTYDGRWFVLDVVRLRGNPGDVKKVVKQTAELDGRACPVVVPIDYSSGLVVLDDMIELLAGYQVHGVKEQGAKEVRIATLQPQVQSERVHLVQGAWVGPFLDEAAHFPTAPHDDQLDALAGAFLWAVDRGHVSLEQVGAALAHTAEVAAIGASRYRGDDEDDDDGGGLGGFRVAV